MSLLENGNFLFKPEWAWTKSTYPILTQFQVPPTSISDLDNRNTWYSSTNYVLLGICSYNVFYSLTKPKNSIHWNNLYQSIKAPFLRLKNKIFYQDTINNSLLVNTSNLSYLIDNFNFVSILYDNNFNEVSPLLSMNQGLTDGNLVTSTEKIAKLFAYLIQNSKNAPNQYPWINLPAGFIDKYILFFNPSESSKNNYLRDPFFSSTTRYSAGLMNMSDYYGNIFKSSHWMGHAGQSYGIQSSCVCNVISRYIVSFSIVTNSEGGIDLDTVTPEIVTFIEKTLKKNIEKKNIDKYLSDNLKKEIAIIISRKLFTNRDYGIELVNYLRNNNLRGYNLSFSYIVTNELINITKSYNFTINFNWFLTKESEEVIPKSIWLRNRLKNTLSKYVDKFIFNNTNPINYNWGSCGTKLITALESITMVSIINKTTDKDQLWKGLDESFLKYINNDVTDFRLKDRDIEINPGVTNINSSQKMGLRELLDENIKDIKLGGFLFKKEFITIKKLIYMSSLLNDFDGSFYPDPDVRTDGEFTATDLTFLGNYTIESQNIWKAYNYGPMQWVSMAMNSINTSDFDKDDLDNENFNTLFIPTPLN